MSSRANPKLNVLLLELESKVHELESAREAAIASKNSLATALQLEKKRVGQCKDWIKRMVDAKREGDVEGLKRILGEVEGTWVLNEVVW